MVGGGEGAEHQGGVSERGDEAGGHTRVREDRREATAAMRIMPARGPIEVFDERLAPVVRGAGALERLCTGAIWSEGPVWIREDDSVLWSDIPNNRMLRWSRARRHERVP